MCWKSGIRTVIWHSFHKVTKQNQDTVEALLNAGIVANRKRIKEEIPSGDIGSAQRVISCKQGCIDNYISNGLIGRGSKNKADRHKSRAPS